MDDPGMLWTRVTAMAAVIGWAGALIVSVSTGRAFDDSRAGRAAWIFGGIALLVHSVSAFLLVHQGSHAAAWEHTARRTWETTGLNWGGGLIVNELFLGWWFFDGARLILAPEARLFRTGLYRWSRDATTAFLMLNATALFGPPYWRWIIPALVIVLVSLALHRSRGRQSA